MTLTPTQHELVARAKRYPFGTPFISYVFVGGACWTLCNYNGDELRNASVEVDGRVWPIGEALVRHGYDPAALSVPRLAVLASGSNASPTRLKEKFSLNSDQTLIPVIKYQISDLVPVFSAKFASYGSITATLQYAPGTQSEMFVTYLTEPQLTRMHETESIGDEYHFARMDKVTIRHEGGDPATEPIYSYLSIKGVFQVDNLQFTLSGSETSAPEACFLARSQEQMLRLAWKLLENNKNLDVFIYENICNESIRRRRNDLLQAYSTSFDNRSIEIIESPVDALFKTNG